MKTICFAITGAIFEVAHAKEVIRMLTKDYKVIVVISQTVFQAIGDEVKELEYITGNKNIVTTFDAEPICRNNKSDAMVIYPCTGNTLAKIANGISDTVVTFLAKAHQRNFRPLVLAISTNDGLGLNFYNIATLINAKDVYFVPFYQDEPKLKPKSLKAKSEFIKETIDSALNHEQIEPVLWRDDV